MNQELAVKLCRQLISLIDQPEEGLSTWHEACRRTAEDLRQALGSGAHLVLCTSSKAEGGSGHYELSTRRVFLSLKAAEQYADGISSSRTPIITELVRGDVQLVRSLKDMTRETAHFASYRDRKR